MAVGDHIGNNGSFDGEAILTSSDGVNWVLRQSGMPPILYDVVYGNGQFVVVGGFIPGIVTILTSSDGVSWVQRTSGISDSYLSGIAYGNGQFVAVGYKSPPQNGNAIILSSSDGVNWVQRSSGSTDPLSDIAYGNGQFVAVGSAILTSSDGAKWAPTMPCCVGPLSGIAYGNGQFVTVGVCLTCLLTSSDGVNWVWGKTGAQSWLSGIAYGNGQFVAVGGYGTITTSSNELNWLQRTSGTTEHLSAVAYGNGQFVAVGDKGTILTSRAVVAPGTVANRRASQRPGTTLVDLFYDLSGAGSGYSASVAVSSDSGAAFAVPATHFTGDGVTTPAAPGTGRHIVWDAGADLGAGYFPNVVVRVSIGGSSATSSVFPVNLRGLAGGLAMSGTVLDGGTGKPLAGANVRLGTASAQTDAQGRFQFASVAVGDYALTASLAGYVMANDSVSVTPGSSPARVIALQRLTAPGSAPRVTSVTSKYPGFRCYLDGVPFSLQFTATVDWAGHPPGKVQFLTPRRTVELTTSGPTASQTLDMGSEFGPNGRLRVVAVSTDGTRSTELVAKLVVAPRPFLMVFGPVDEGGDFHYEGSLSTSLFEFGIGPGTISADIPFFGGKDMSLGFLPAVDVQVTSDGTAQVAMQWSDAQAGKLLDNEWGAKRDPADIASLLNDLLQKGTLDSQQLPHASFGGMDLSFYPQLGGAWKYNPDAGQWQWRDAFAGLAGDFSVSQTWPFLAGPVPMYAKVQVGVAGDATVHLLQLSPANFNGQLDVNPSLSGTLGVGLSGVLSADGTVQGGAYLDLQWPQEPTMKDFSLDVNASVSLHEWIFHEDFKVFHWIWPANGLLQSKYPVLRQETPWQPLGRDYLQHPSHGAVAPFFKSRKKSDGGGGTVEILLSPVFPYSDPNCSSSGTNVYLAFLTDNTNRASMNRTMAMFTKFDGANWSQAVAIADDGTADFHPHLLSFPDGSAVAAWENEGAVLPDSATLDLMKSNLEVSVAWFNPNTGTWLPAWQVTTNSFLDRSPKLAGRSKDNVLLTWVANPANDENGGPTSPNQVWSARWNGGAWSNPQLAATVSNALVKYGLAYDGTTANLVLSVDTVSGSTNVDGHELFRVVYQNEAWGPLTQLTSDQVPDDNPQLTLDPQGNVVLTWLKGAELSSVVNFVMTNRQVLRTNEYSSNLADFTLAASGGGKRVVLWAEPSENSSDLFAMFYDPVAGVWGAPKQLTHDPQTERGTTAAFVGEGELVTVYNRTLLSSTNAPGTSLADLAALVYPLGEDLALDGSSIYSDPPNPNPGGTATLHVKALNLGDQVETNVVVAFYRDAVQAASELGRATVTNAIPPQGTNDVTFTWSVSATNSLMTVFAVIDPDQRVPDVSRSNNIARLDLVKPDTGIESMSWARVSSNLLAVTVRVGNDGAIDSGPATLSLQRDSATGTNVFSQDVAGLEPGQSVDLSFVWNVAGLPDNLALFAVLSGPGMSNNFTAAKLTGQLAISQVPPPWLGEGHYLPDGRFQLTAYGEAGRSYTVQVSTNLLDWTPLTTLVNTNGTMTVVDPATTNLNYRFYRAVAP
ncbi:MAG: carboxypeptidase regulatory-like domain-containing protein [Limisphaerales bacterium]